MHYEPDLKYEEASKLIKGLIKEKTNLNPREELLFYFIQKESERKKELEREINEYQEVFNGIGRFLPRDTRDILID
ncbi:hypothetical protein M0R72_03855 [Candidatus Pacearchaeota archaeon]|jgi:hypothetical protein|nr:hypothetical protein [Candidatus Pacearchaeota archaeon]